MNRDSVKKARLWLAVVFLVGAAIGIVFGYSFGHHTVIANTAPSPMSEPERRAKRVAEMSKELGLNAEQGAKMDEIIKSAHEQIKGIRDNSEKEVDTVRQSARNQMRAMLTDEQRPKFEAIVQRMDEERKKAQQQSAGK